MRIDFNKMGNKLIINAVTNKDNENNGHNCCIQHDEDVKNLINFISTMQANDFNIVIKKVAFKVEEMSKDAINEVKTYYQNLINSYNEKINKLKQNPDQNQNAIINLLDKIKIVNDEERFRTRQHYN